jgi:peptidoglycan/xylan/chitin deacetylase (PgdA/CDA1 family)
MIVSRGISLLADPRLPLFFPLNSSRWNSLGRRIERVDLGSRPELDVLFTMDVEYDYGSAGSGSAKHVLPFLKQAKEFFSRHGIRATLFVQGDLAEKAAEGVHRLGQGHEIGLHGYAHEPWGASWFIGERLPSVVERKALLEKSLAAFERAGFRRPTSFRAPNMVIDGASLSLLKEHGFASDSSFPSYSGGLPLMGMRHGLAEIPVSFDPKPLFGKFLMARYLVFNTHNLARHEFRDGFMNSAMRTVKAQVAAGQKPFLVFLSHPWEFFRPDAGFDNEFFGYSSESNFAVLADAVSQLRMRFSLRFTTVSEFAASARK